MKNLSKLFEAPKATEVPYFGFYLFITIPTGLIFVELVNRYLQAHSNWFGVINIVFIIFWTRFVSKLVIAFIEKHHNEHNAKKWFIANIVFGIATIYMVLIGIVFFN